MSEREVLPKGLKPIHYDLSIYDIDFDALQKDAELDDTIESDLKVAKYRGTVVIDFRVEDDVSVIQLNSRNLEIEDALVTYTSGKTEYSAPVVNITDDTKLERVYLKLDQVISAANTRTVRLKLVFVGYIMSNMSSFYRAKYSDASGKKSFLLVTQFEAIEARGAFPCADEPNLKATFDVKITVPESYTALGNMPVMSSKSVGDGKKKVVPQDGLKTVTFERTPKMSSYLLAWAVGEFEYIEAFTTKEYGKGEYSKKRIPVRVYTTKGLSGMGGLALQTATKCVDYFTDLFDIEYPLPKLDLIAVHDFSANAMENYGLITFRETALLFDSAGDGLAESNVAYVVAHELAHQWFGNLVTMDWWESLWLNEGFATYVGWLAIENMHPEWDVFTRFVQESYQMALSLDSLRSSHPVEVAIRAGYDIDQYFDAISYRKGASLIRMISDSLGVETFTKGVSSYLKRYSYDNATTGDLWNSLSEASGIDVKKALGNWTSVTGYPLIELEETSSGSIIVKQRRFLSSGDVKPEEDLTKWWIPLNISTGLDSGKKESILLEADSLDISQHIPKNGFFKLNKDQIGLYRTKYPDHIFKTILSNTSELSTSDKIGLVSDTYAVALAGLGSISSFLDLISALRSDDDYYVWLEILNRLSELGSIWGSYDKDVATGISKLTASLVNPLLAKLTWKVSSNDDYRRIQLRGIIASSAASTGTKEVIAACEELFTKFINGDAEAIHPSLRTAVFNGIMKYSEGPVLKQAFDYLSGESKNPSKIDNAVIAAVALGQARNTELLDKIVAFGLTGGVFVKDIHFLYEQLSKNAAARSIAWKYVKTNFSKFLSVLGNNVLIERFVRTFVANFASEEDYEEISSFFESVDQTGFNSGLAQSLDYIRNKSQFSKRETNALRTWLSANEFISISN